MILRYGGYTHGDGEVTITVSKEKTYAETGEQTGYKEAWTIRGVLHADTVPALTNALAALEDAYSINGNNLILYESNGSTPTVHSLINSNTASGVRITKISYPVGDNTEYVASRTYEIEAEAQIIKQNVEFDEWNETITVKGGGPKFVYLQTLTGPPQKQIVAQSTPYFATQSGTAVGLLAYPRFPPPLFPQHEHLDQRVQSRASPQVQPNTPSKFQIDWTYEYESASPLFGVPGIP